MLYGVVLGRPKRLPDALARSRPCDHSISDHRPLEFAEYANMPNNAQPHGVEVSPRDNFASVG